MRNRDRIAAALVVVTLAVSLFAVGSVLRWTVLLSAFLATACAVPYVTSKRSITSRSPLLLFLLMVFAFTLFQVIPLPAALVKVLSAGKYELIAGNAKALGLSTPSMMSLSYAPGTTLLELAKFASYVLFAFACLRLSAHRQGKMILCIAVGGAGVALALTAHAHELMGIKKLYGVYAPSWTPKFLSPLLNENHLAGFLCMTTPVCLGLAVVSRGAMRLVWVSAIVLGLGTVLLTGSRGGVVAVGIGMLLAGGMLLLQRRRGTRDASAKIPLSVLVPAGVVTVCACVLLGALTAGGVAKEFARTARTDVVSDESKINLWRESSTLLAQNRWTGVGRGGFEFAHTRVHSSNYRTFSHVENEALQTVLDFGIPMAAALSLAMILLVVTGARRWQTGPMEATVLAGLVAITLQNMADFNLEFPSVALAAIALVAALIPPTLSRPSASRSRTTRYFRIVALATSALVLVFAMGRRTSGAQGDAAKLEAMIKNEAPAEKIATTARRLFQRHPADYVIAGLTAQSLFQARDQRQFAFDVAKRALALNPKHAGLNQLAARMLMNATPPRVDDALIQYSVAMTHARNPSGLISEVLSLFPDAKIAAQAFPLDPDRAKNLSKYLMRDKAFKVAFLYAKRLNANIPNDSRVLALLANAALADGQHVEALSPARLSYNLTLTTEAALLLIKAELANTNPTEAAKVIVAALEVARKRGATTEIVSLSFMQIDFLTSQSQYEKARTIAHQLKGLVGGDRRKLGRVHLRLAVLESKLGNSHQAVWERNRAKQLLARPR